MAAPNEITGGIYGGLGYGASARPVIKTLTLNGAWQALPSVTVTNGAWNLRPGITGEARIKTADSVAADGVDEISLSSDVPGRTIEIPDGRSQDLALYLIKGTAGAVLEIHGTIA